MKTATTCQYDAFAADCRGREPDRDRRDPALWTPVRYWLRIGERLFHYRLLRAQMIERAFMPDDRSGDSR